MNRICVQFGTQNINKKRKEIKMMPSFQFTGYKVNKIKIKYQGDAVEGKYTSAT